MQIMRMQKRGSKNFPKWKNLEEYHNFHVQKDALLLADVFGNIRNMCLEIYKLNFAKFHSAPRLAWKPALKKAKAKLDLLTNIYFLLMVGEGISATLFIDMQKLLTNKWKIMMKIKNRQSFNIGM